MSGIFERNGRAVTEAIATAALILVFTGVAAAEVFPTCSVGWEAAFGGPSHPTSQGYLGVDIRDVSEEQLAALKLREAHGAEVVRVDHDAPAGKAGLREHDVILQMNGETVQGEEQLRRMLRETPAGRDITLVISRDGHQQTISTRLGNRTEVERQAWEQHFTVPEPEPAAASNTAAPAPAAQVPSHTNGFFSGTVNSATTHSRSFLGSLISGSSYTGAMVETMGPQLAEFFGVPQAGVLVHSVDANSPAATAGLRAGDIVLRANEITVSSTSDWLKVMHENKGKPVGVLVLREKKQQTLSLTPDAKRRSSLEPQKKPENTSAVLTMASYSLR